MTGRRLWSDVRRNERGDIITGWLTQLLIFFAVITFIGHETLTIVVTAISLEDPARRIAKEAAEEFVDTDSTADAMEVALAQAEEDNVELVDLQIDENLSEVTATVSRFAGTWVIHKISFMESWTRPSTSGVARVN